MRIQTVSSRVRLLYAIQILLLLSGSTLSAVEEDPEGMFQRVFTQLQSINETQPSTEMLRVSVPNTAGIDAVVICDAYITEAELGSGLSSLGLPKSTLGTIETISNVQDGTYIFLLRNGQILSRNSLGENTAIAERVIGAEVGETLILEVAKLDRKNRPVEIRAISGSR